jgi:oligopeptide/dipeptide ABC transporter ATP-binding protein
VALLEVEDLHVTFGSPDGQVPAVRGVSFSVDTGQTLGIVGESGSGKSVSAQAIVGLVRGAAVSGRARFEGHDLLAMRADELRKVRGPGIGMIFQDPLSSLHPQYTVGWQIAEMIRAHRKVGRAQARLRAVELLGLVGIPDPRRRVDDYPHQLSGGMRQRAMIAMALALDPKLIIADEPTTALDVTVQAQILQLIKDLQARLGMAVIIITHDLGVIAGTADQVMIMYLGKPMEYADTRTLFHHPHHPYSRGLLESLPARGQRHQRFRPIAGTPPSPLHVPSGCPFHPRCRYVLDRCPTDEPAPMPVPGGHGHRSACWLPGDELAPERPPTAPAGGALS